MNNLAGFPIEYVVVIAVVLLVIVVLLAGVKSVPQGYEYTVERFGRFTHVLSPGLNLIVPFIDRIGRKVNMMENVLDVPSQEVITRDNAMVKVDGVVFFQVLNSAKASYEVAYLQHSILNLSVTNLRTVMGSMDLDELLSKRDEINARLLTVIDEATHPWGVKLTRVEIKDITPPRDLVDAMARQMKAEREKRAAILEAEGMKQSEVLRAEGEKQSAILKAEGLRQSTILRAEAEKQTLVLEAEGQKEAAFRTAEARERSAQAEAEATRMVSEALAKGEMGALNYFVAQKYVEALSNFAESENQKLLLLPMESSSLLGAAAGMMEVFKDSGKKGKA